METASELQNPSVPQISEELRERIRGIGSRLVQAYKAVDTDLGKLGGDAQVIFNGAPTQTQRDEIKRYADATLAKAPLVQPILAITQELDVLISENKEHFIRTHPRGRDGESHGVKILRDSGLMDILEKSTFCDCAINLKTSKKPGLRIAGGTGIIDMITSGEASPPVDKTKLDTLLGRVISAIHLHTEAAVGHRNRIQEFRHLLAHLTKKLDRETTELPINIGSVGTGSGTEWAEILKEFGSEALKRKLHVLGVDFDPGTLTLFRKTLERENVRAERDGVTNRIVGIETITANVYTLTLDHIARSLGVSAPQVSNQLQDLLYMLGVFDYVPDSAKQEWLRVLAKNGPLGQNKIEQIMGADFAACTLAMLEQMVKPGGLLVVTQVNDNIPVPYYLALILNWELELRGPERMREMAEAIGYTYRADLSGPITPDRPITLMDELKPGEFCIMQEACGVNHMVGLRRKL